jgi:hypothetical protein
MAPPPPTSDTELLRQMRAGSVAGSLGGGAVMVLAFLLPLHAPVQTGGGDGRT